MKNVTVTLDEETAVWVRVYAAEQNMSVSRFIGEMLAARRRQRSEYERAMRSALSKASVKFDKSVPYPRREELYDRGRLR